MYMKFTLIRAFLIPAFILFAAACGEAPPDANSGDASANAEADSEGPFLFEITEQDDEAYPDNPDIGYRAADYNFDYFKGGRIENVDGFHADLSFFINDGTDSIAFAGLNLRELIPAIPACAKGDEYLSEIALVNQEWNRNQVRFAPGEFSSTDERIVRADIARNCLNAYLWEVIVYVEEDGEQLPYAHGWFDFPEGLYHRLFLERNEVPFSRYADALEDWKDPENKPIDMNRIRRTENTVNPEWEDKSDEMYPVAGERERKFQEIIYPESFDSMRELQSDSTTFATFSPPGNYDREDPRKTELGRFYRLEGAELSTVSFPDNENFTGEMHEIHLTFRHRESDAVTHLYLGGIDFSEIPVLSVEKANDGWQNSMGFGNHTFYESAADHLSRNAAEHPYYGFLTDADGNWLDSHRAGIDGPLLHFDSGDPDLLHVWILSFERHALAGHYCIDTSALAKS